MSNPYAPPSPDRPTPDDRPERAPEPQPTPAPSRRALPPEPAPEPPNPEAVLATGRLVRHFGVWMLAAVVVGLLPLPWGVASLAFIVGAVITGIRALRTATKGRVGGGLAPLVVIGLGLAGMLGLMTLAPLAVWPAQQDLQQCLGSAVTETARTGCQVEFEQQSTELLNRWLPSS
ncbi:hypothetical protein [Cellulomonas sp. NPDC089187]|uniref:hypothetical protein n=1 Tax=Cellulomonas sp. NPDC089187 TaxID=3154970 RepID=UPI0034430E95